MAGTPGSAGRDRTGQRYLFLCPDKKKASGGIAVLYDMVAELRRNGYDAVILHGERGARYPDGHAEAPIFASPSFLRAMRARFGVRRRIASWISQMAYALRGGIQTLEPEASDVIVVPEFLLAEAVAAFPQNRKVLISQNPFSHLRAYARLLKQGREATHAFVYAVGVSEICVGVCDLLGSRQLGYVPVTMWPERFPFQQNKEKLVTFMPRKRREEATIIEAVLRARGKLHGYRLEAIDGIPLADVAERLARSRFFISLQSREGLGFPAAEAMASGCVVVGYTGLGGDEYFDTTTGIPVPEGDTAALVRAVEAAIGEYEENPERLDRIRHHASDTVNRKYSRDAFVSNLQRVWAEVETAVAAADGDVR